jgi:hypothetical protein
VPFVSLRDITPVLKAEAFELTMVEKHFADLQPSAPFGERVSACILGVP